MQSFCQIPLARGLGSPLRTDHGRLQKQHLMGRNQRPFVWCKAEESPNGSARTTTGGKKEKIYLGKGRYTEDDPEKYPRKENGLGFLTGISGGWAGGEVGLKNFTKDVPEGATEDKPSGTASQKGVKADFMGREVQATKVGPGDDTLYIGWKTGSQEDLLSRKAGNMGRFIIDDAKKYPSKESLGVFNGLTGGFAGGERGVQQFVEEGDISFADPSQRSGQWSPVVVATIVAGVGSIGAILLTDIVDISSDLLKSDVLSVGLDDNTKLLLEAAIGLLGVAWIGSAGFALFKSLREGLSSGAQGATKIVIGAGFWLAVLVVAYRLVQS